MTCQAVEERGPRRRIGILVWPALLLMLLTGATGPASGQSETFNALAFEFGDLPAPATLPPGASETFQVDLTVRCQADNLYVEPPRIDLHLETSQQQEDAALFTLEPTTVILPFGQGNCAAPDNREHHVQINVTASVPGDSRAFTRSNAEIVVEHDGGERKRSDRITVETAFVGRYEVDHQSVWQAERNSMLMMPITIANTGNGDLEVRLTSEQESRLATGGAFVLPSVWILPTPIGGSTGHTADLPIDYRSTYEGSGPINETFTIIIEPASADERSLRLEPTTVTFHIEVTGIYVDAAGIDGIVSVSAALLLVGVAGRRGPLSLR